jgi:hypothetical protein
MAEYLEIAPSRGRDSRPPVAAHLRTSTSVLIIRTYRPFREKVLQNLEEMLCSIRAPINVCTNHCVRVTLPMLVKCQGLPCPSALNLYPQRIAAGCLAVAQ